MSNNIATLRAKHNFSQQKLADLVGATKLTLGRWERGEAVPRKYSRDKLCEVLGCDEEDLGFSQGSVSLVTTDMPQDLIEPIDDVAIPFAPKHPLVGREQDLIRIKAALWKTEGGVVLIALNGLPGVGKTSLVITLVHDHEIRAYFSDGVLWAGLGPTPNLAGLLSRWAGLLGISETQFTEFSEDQKRQALRTTIGTRSILLVLDDVWKLEDALALHVGGHNCAYLITTRFPAIATHLAVENAMMIEELNEEQSIHLLRVLAPEVVDREETKVHELVHAVGGLPLALTLLGNYLRKQAYSARRTSAALERLGSINERFKIGEPHLQSGAHPSLSSLIAISLSSIIKVSDHFLTPAAHETLYALAVFPPKPESFSEEAALAVAACTTHELDELVDAGLLQAQSADRYRLHRIIADYARLHLDERTEHLVTLRLLVYMQQYVQRHTQEYELLEQEITLILYALDKAVTGEAFQSQVVPFVCAAAPFLLMRGYYQETQHFLDRAYELAAASRESADMATVLLFLGQISEKRGDLSCAQEQYKQGKVLAELSNDVALRGILMHHVGRMSWKMGDYQEAEALLQEGLAFARAMEQPKLVSEMCKTLAALCADRADYAQAEAYAREGLSIARQLGDREQILALLINLGCSLQAHPSRPASLREALLIAREIKSDEQCCLVLINLGDWYTNSPESDFPRAEACLREAISIARRLGISEWTSVALSGLTTVLRQEGRLSEAEDCVQEAFVLAKEAQRARCMCAVLEEMGNLALIYGDQESALLRFQEMHRLCPQGDAEMQAMSMFGLARTYEQLEQWEQAQSFGQRSLVLLRRKNQVQHIDRVQTWYTNLVQRFDNRMQDSLGVETCICGKPLERASGSGRIRRYCSDRCRKRAQRERGTGGDVTK
jgi:transcriptional regulator with XRE-family HTH domain/tetratricopeptide (TPR) repeat protein